MKLKNHFIDRVIRKGLLDTRKYRYIACELSPIAVGIYRIEKSLLDTTECISLDNWEEVERRVYA